MAPRVNLQALLELILGSNHVYFQPPENIEMQHPAIVYSLDQAATQFAGNRPYFYEDRYQVTHITRDPDDPVRRALADLPKCRFNRSFRADNLNHNVFILYF